MEYYLHIKPTFNCLLKTQDITQELTKNRLHTFLVNTKENLNLSFYPVDEENKNSLPFAAVLKIENNIIKTNKKQLNIITFPDNNYLIEVQPFLFSYPSSFQVENKQIKTQNTTHTLSWLKQEKCFLNISNNQNNSCLKLDLKKEITDLNLKQKNNFIFGFSKCLNQQHIVFCVKYEFDTYTIITNQVVDILEEEQNKITTYKNLHDFAGHGVITTYNFENTFEETLTLVYNNSSPIIARHKEIIPYSFFEAIKIKNFKLAKSYLTKELSQRLTNNHLEQFFGEFESIHQTLCPKYNPEEIALIYNTPYKHAKVFVLKLKDNKIENIIQL